MKEALRGGANDITALYAKVCCVCDMAARLGQRQTMLLPIFLNVTNVYIDHVSPRHMPTGKPIGTPLSPPA